METLSSNIAAYSAQIICVVAVGTLVSWLLRMEVAGVRYAYWRALLALCLLLPLLQGRQMPRVNGEVSVTVGIADALAAAPVDAAAPLSSIDWMPLTLSVLAAGAALRLLWIGVSLLRLRRLRRLGFRATGSEIHAELQAIIGTQCEVRYVARLKQPVTFGLWRPVILLPAALANHEADTQRAVFSHELFHVKRHDWGWLLLEEIVCALLWFNPAVWWMVSRVQLAREVVVDELAVLATGRRRAYVEALMAFADETSLAPVAAFGSRRQLFNRIVLLSKEGGMSSHRLVFTCGLMVAIVMLGSWRAICAFPLTAARGAQVVQQKAPGPLEQRANQITPENPVPRRVLYEPPVFPAEARGAAARGSVTLMITLDELGRVAEARRIRLSLTSTIPPVSLTLGGSDSDAEAQFLINRSAQASDAVRTIGAAFTDAAVRAVGQWRYDPPAVGPISFPITVTFSETGDATALRARGRVSDPSPDWSQGALRVGSTITTPIKTHDVRPVYPPIAMAARVSGIVILEARVGSDGSVEDARVIKSIPLLDQAALDAVMEWRFKPTLLNGLPVPVIMTLAVNFVLEPPAEAVEVVPGTRQMPVLLKKVRPVYPELALRAGVEGTVEVEVTIGTDGKVVDRRVIRSIPLLDEAALTAVRQWEFEPAARAVLTTIELTFSTKRSPARR